MGMFFFYFLYITYNIILHIIYCMLYIIYFTCICKIIYIICCCFVMGETWKFIPYYCVKSNINLCIIINQKLHDKLEVRLTCYKHVFFLPHSKFYCHRLMVSPSQTCLWDASRIHSPSPSTRLYPTFSISRVADHQSLMFWTGLPPPVFPWSNLCLTPTDAPSRKQIWTGLSLTKSP